jgi:hypothetical protein
LLIGSFAGTILCLVTSDTQPLEDVCRFFGFIQRSSWKGYSRKFAKKVVINTAIE